MMVASKAVAWEIKRKMCWRDSKEAKLREPRMLGAEEGGVKYGFWIPVWTTGERMMTFDEIEWGILQCALWNSHWLNWIQPGLVEIKIFCGGKCLGSTIVTNF